MRTHVLWALVFIACLFHSQWARPGMPDVTWIFFIPLVLHSESRWDYLWALIAGVLKDGLQPGLPWLSPLLFVLAIGLGQFARNTLNMRWFVSKLLFTMTLILLDGLRLLFLYGLSFWPLILKSIGLTLILTWLSVFFLE